MMTCKHRKAVQRAAFFVLSGRGARLDFPDFQAVKGDALDTASKKMFMRVNGCEFDGLVFALRFDLNQNSDFPFNPIFHGALL